MPYASSEELLVEFEENILTITLNRPDRMNAISGPMLSALSDTLQTANIDPDVRVIVFTGSGRGFCAGLDLKDQMANGSNATGRAGYRLFDLQRAFARAPLPFRAKATPPRRQSAPSRSRKWSHRWR